MMEMKSREQCSRFAANQETVDDDEYPRLAGDAQRPGFVAGPRRGLSHRWTQIRSRSEPRRPRPRLCRCWQRRLRLRAGSSCAIWPIPLARTRRLAPDASMPRSLDALFTNAQCLMPNAFFLTDTAPSSLAARESLTRQRRRCHRSRRGIWPDRCSLPTRPAR